MIAIFGSSIINGRNALDIARERRADAVMTKPFRAAALSAALSQLLSARESA